MAFPKRIWIVGPSGGGKSTLAIRLGDQLHLPVTQLDDIHWNPGWVESDHEDEAGRVAAITEGDGWIIEGNYHRIRNPLHDRIDLVVWLDPHLWLAVARVIRRTLRRVIRREECCNGNRESLINALFSPDSIVWWALTTHRGRRVSLTRELANRPHVRLSSNREVNAWIDTLRSTDV